MNLVSLFCGPGGLDLGFIRQGFNVIWANDIDSAACETYRHNNGEHVVCKSIKDISVDDIPGCDGIIGGCPCQGFSNANRVTNYLDNPNNQLVKEYIRVVNAKQPKFFVIENVPQFITAGDGAIIKEIQEKLNNYHIVYGVLNAADFNVPQTRKRTIVIGTLDGSVNDLPKPITREYKTVAEAFLGLTDDIPNQKDVTKPKQKTLERMKCIKPGENYEVLPEHLRFKGGQSSVYRRLEWNKPSITVVNPRKSQILHPSEDRILTIRECARIQSFPDDYAFYGKLADKQQQVADAVPPLLAEAVAKHIKSKIY